MFTTIGKSGEIIESLRSAHIQFIGMEISFWKEKRKLTMMRDNKSFQWFLLMHTISSKPCCRNINFTKSNDMSATHVIDITRMFRSVYETKNTKYNDSIMKFKQAETKGLLLFIVKQTLCDCGRVRFQLDNTSPAQIAPKHTSISIVLTITLSCDSDKFS